MEELIRAPEVTRLVSRVAQMAGVRAWVSTNVRKAAEGRDVVVDGRDIGTVVFPDADLKVFLSQANRGSEPAAASRSATGARHRDAEIAEETRAPRPARRQESDADRAGEGRHPDRHHLSHAGGAGGADRLAGGNLSAAEAGFAGAERGG